MAKKHCLCQKTNFTIDFAKEIIYNVYENPIGTDRSFRRFYTKHHLKFRKNQADNLVAVENRFICDFDADFFLYFIGV